MDNATLGIFALIAILALGSVSLFVVLFLEVVKDLSE